MIKRGLCTTLLLATAFLAAWSQLKVYPESLNPGLPHNDDYTVRVREKGGNWKDLYEYRVDVDMDNVQQASMVQFDMGSPVEVMVKKNNGMVNDVKIRPLIHNITHTEQGNTIVFTLEQPKYLSIEFNGDRLHNLHLFANPLETEIPQEGDENVMYFGPGIHRPQDLPGLEIHIPSNTTVYLAPGALVRAKLTLDRVENVRIIGRGILDHPQRGVEITHSKNVTIDGITVLNPDHYSIYGGASKGLHIKNFKSFSCKGWSDGIDLMSCSDVNIDGIFMCNSDDCLAFYNHRWNYWGDTRNFNVQNAVLWADVAHPINIGGHGNDESAEGEVVENLRFHNIDILEQDEDDPNYQGCMAICCGDRNRVRNILFENIRVENIQEGRLFHLNTYFNEKYNKQPGNGIENIIFRNITYNGYGENPSLIMGYDSERMTKNITFENIVINGKKMKDTKDFITNEYIQDIQVK